MAYGRRPYGRGTYGGGVTGESFTVWAEGSASFEFTATGEAVVGVNGTASGLFEFTSTAQAFTFLDLEGELAITFTPIANLGVPIQFFVPAALGGLDGLVPIGKVNVTMEHPGAISGGRPH